MIAGVRGRLVTASFARDVLPALGGVEPAPPDVRRELDSWYQRCDAALGPASSVRAICETALAPLLRILGFSLTPEIHADVAWLRTSASVTGVCVGWNEALAHTWRAVVRQAIGDDARWCFCCNGTTLRVVDARRTWSRDYLEFDLAALSVDREAQSLCWALMRADAMRREPPVLDRAVVLSARYGIEVCDSLGRGVLEAIQLLLAALQQGIRIRPPAERLFEHSLTVVYRVLFLLFAEARGLVPMWHPVYRDRYSLDSIVTTLLSGRRYRGLWLAIQAISRLAHAGCTAGELKVTAFNGRLFSPSQSTAFDRARIADEVIGQAVVAVSSTGGPARGARSRITYRDLDVEQLGAVYERLLDYEPAGDGPHALVRRGDARKASGTFYTPRAVTAFLVRRTLEPLVRGRSAGDILRLRLLDPAMGSGAFLVGACRYLASAVEDALIREGAWHPNDVTPADRVQLRRDIASRCLFGVDLNPMAVQLARLSLWLATLSADKPLSFLDHHLMAGNSLVGATPDDARRQPAGGGRAARRPGRLPLFAEEGLSTAVGDSVAARTRLALEPDESAAVVRAKEQALAALQARGAGLNRWSRALDLWCAGWFWEKGSTPDRGTFQELAGSILHGRSALPAHVRQPLLARAEHIAARQRFLHWPLAFPEVFADEDGAALADAGFDAVIGNPPWDMVRGDSGDGDVRLDRRTDAQRFTAFVRESGIYHVDSRAHTNRYQLFVERALQLARPGGRIGLVLPAGLATDTGAAPLRRFLFDHADVDELTGLDNRQGIFPIHRSVRFVLLSCTAGRPTRTIRCRFGLTHPEELERDESSGARAPLVLTRGFVSRLSGEDDLGIPELAGDTDLRIVERISAVFPRLGSDAGWHVQFGRELNATDDRGAFTAFTGNAAARAVIEGKQIEPFRAAIDRCTLELRLGSQAGRRVPRRARLAYRDVASATNRLTLIAAIVPARAVTTHTLFCLKKVLPICDQHVLCALLNSFVANYLIRLRVNTHVTVSLVSRLPVPVVRAGEPEYELLLSWSRQLAQARDPVETMPEYASLQALAARLYRCTPAEFEHILSRFPLISPETRDAALARFNDVHRNGPRSH
jgi:hypothetical protein